MAYLKDNVGGSGGVKFGTAIFGYSTSLWNFYVTFDVSNANTAKFRWGHGSQSSGSLGCQYKLDSGSAQNASLGDNTIDVSNASLLSISSGNSYGWGGNEIVDNIEIS